MGPSISVLVPITIYLSLEMGTTTTAIKKAAAERRHSVGKIELLRLSYTPDRAISEAQEAAAPSTSASFL